MVFVPLWERSLGPPKAPSTGSTQELPREPSTAEWDLRRLYAENKNRFNKHNSRGENELALSWERLKSHELVSRSLE
ncbi:hypothetical protein DPMN_078320 [Dreissena polymorpha]|uniref:Uncharacterized protein n=1 Tax=Dreissena polymorpha TaxID=45954 RepID=A0A9D3YS95_DREPO|nr:hypothetical protein DPMN_078320 [Dreissena polymorpha]